MIKISIITVAYNSAATIRSTLQSVAKQDYPAIEHIIIDGQSKDETLSIVKEFPHVKTIVSEPDQGIYDAMNKGIRLATGDYIGTLNSDDFYPDKIIISKIAAALASAETDALIADILFVAPNNLKKPIRYYSAKKWQPNLFVRGFMPPHPSFFVKRQFFETLGDYKTDYSIAADYELLIRFLYANKLSYVYLHEPVVYMRAGGVSNNSIKSRWILNQEIIRACAENGLSTNMLKLSLKYFQKVFEYWPALNKKRYAG